MALNLILSKKFNINLDDKIVKKLIDNKIIFDYTSTDFVKFFIRKYKDDFVDLVKSNNDFNIFNFIEERILSEPDLDFDKKKVLMNLFLIFYIFKVEAQDLEDLNLLLNEIKNKELLDEDLLFINKIILRLYLKYFLYLNSAEIKYTKLSVYDNFKHANLYLNSIKGSSEINQFLNVLISNLNTVRFNDVIDNGEEGEVFTVTGNFYGDLKKVKNFMELIEFLDYYKDKGELNKEIDIMNLFYRKFGVYVLSNVNEYIFYKSYINSNISEYKFNIIKEDITLDSIWERGNVKLKEILIKELFNLKINKNLVDKVKEEYLNELYKYIKSKKNKSSVIGFIFFNKIEVLKDLIVNKYFDIIDANLVIDGLLDRYVLEEKFNIISGRIKVKKDIENFLNLFREDNIKVILEKDEVRRNIEMKDLYEIFKNEKLYYEIILYLLNSSSKKYFYIIGDDNTLITNLKDRANDLEYIFDFNFKVKEVDNLKSLIISSIKNNIVKTRKKVNVNKKSAVNTKKDKFKEYIKKVNPDKLKEKILEDLL